MVTPTLLSGTSLSTSAVLSATTSLHQSADRRKILADLAGVQEMLDRFEMTDSLSERIRQWCKNFTRGLKERSQIPGKRESDEERLRRMISIHLIQIQELLRDPLTNTPLDKEAVLGSDGEVYGLKALSLAIRSLSPELRGRSPRHPDDPSPFTKRNHPVAQHMVRFLETWGALEAAPELEASFKELFDQGPLPVIPETPSTPVASPLPVSTISRSRPSPSSSSGPARIMTIQDLIEIDDGKRNIPEDSRAPAKRYPTTGIVTLTDIRARDAEAAAERKTPAVEEAPSHSFLSDEDMADLKALIEEHEQREAQDRQRRKEEELQFDRRLERMVATVRAGLDKEFESIRIQREDFAKEIREVIQDLNEQNEADVQQLQQEIEQLNKEIADVEHEIQQLPANISALQKEILQAQKEERELEKEIKELQAIIKKRKKSNLGPILRALSLVSACIGATVVAASMAKYWALSSGTKMAFAPMNKGAKVMLKIPV